MKAKSQQEYQNPLPNVSLVNPLDYSACKIKPNRNKGEKKITTASPIEKSKEILWYKYFETFNFYFSKPIDEIISDVETPHVMLFKDYLYYDDEREFLRRSYTINEFQERHKLLCSLYNNLDFMTRPNLAGHAQNNIIMKRNLKLQKLFFTKFSAETDCRELLAQKIPVIPRYIEDNIYSTTTEVDTPKTKQLTVSFEEDSQFGKNVLNSLRNQEENSSRKNIETAVYNAGDSKINSQNLVNEVVTQQDMRVDSYRKIEMDMKGLKDTEPISLGSSFNSGNAIPQIVQGVPSLFDSRWLLSDEKDLIYNYNATKVNGVPTSPVQQQQTGSNKLNEPYSQLGRAKQQSPLFAKRKTYNLKNFDVSADPRVALQSFSKASNQKKNDTESHSSLSPPKNKIENSQKRITRNLMQGIHTDVKKEVQLQHQAPSLADKLLLEKIPIPSTKSKNMQASRDQNTQDRGFNPRVSVSPKLHKINLNKSPPKGDPLNTPIDTLSLVVETKSLAKGKPENLARMKEEKSPVLAKRSPATAKIFLNNTCVLENSTNESTDGSGHNNKSIIPSIKNLVKKLNSKQAITQGSGEFLKTIKDNNFNLNTFTESPLLSKPETTNSPLVSGKYQSQSNHLRCKTQGSEPLTTSFQETELQTDLLSTSVQIAAKGLPNTPSRGQHTNKQATERFPAATEESLDSKADMRGKEALIDRISEKKSMSPAFRFLGKKDAILAPINPHASSDDSFAKAESPDNKGRIARPNTRGGSLSTFDHLRKTVKIDMQIKSDAETRAETRGQSNDSKVLSDDSDGKDPAELPQRYSLGNQSPKLIYTPSKVVQKRASVSNLQTQPKKKTDWKTNFEMPQKANKTAQNENYSCLITSGRSGFTFIEENKAHPNKEFKRLGSSELISPQISQIGNSKSPSRKTAKLDKIPGKKQQQHKTTDQLPDTPSKSGIKLAVAYHCSGKSVGSYPSEKKSLLSEAERLKRREILRKITKSK